MLFVLLLNLAQFEAIKAPLPEPELPPAAVTEYYRDMARERLFYLQGQSALYSQLTGRGWLVEAVIEQQERYAVWEALYYATYFEKACREWSSQKSQGYTPSDSVLEWRRRLRILVGSPHYELAVWPEPVNLSLYKALP